MTVRVVKFVTQDRVLHVAAGPYRERLEGTYVFKLAPEIDAPFDDQLVIPDFGVPKMDAFENALTRITKRMLLGDMVYIGCMGGIGRTGMMLAGLYRVLDGRELDAVSWVRANYLGHAVETQAQRNLVNQFDVMRVRNKLAVPADFFWAAGRQRAKLRLGLSNIVEMVRNGLSHGGERK